jgi:hypothetical protein
MFNHFLWILVFPKVAGVVGGPWMACDMYLEHYKGSQQKCYVLLPMDYQCYLTSWWHSFGPIIELELLILVNNPHQKTILWMNIAT